VNLALTFKPSITRAKTVYMNAQDSIGQSTGLQAKGAWTVP